MREGLLRIDYIHHHMSQISPEITQLSQKEARTIIEYMKRGTTPLDADHLFDHGRQKWYKGMDYFLDSAESGSSHVRFIRGRYGEGKTHFMSMAMYYALKRNFIVSYLSAEDTTLHKFDLLYRSIIKNLQSNTIKDGIEQLLKDWKSRNQNDIPLIVKKLDNPSIEINFRIAIREYLTTDNSKSEENIIRWLLGEKIKLPEMRVKTAINPQNSQDMLRSLSLLIREMGYSGLVVCIDELELVQAQSSPARQKVYNNLRLLLDNTVGQGGMKSAIFYLAASSEMYTSNKGFMEYDALCSRLGPLSNNFGSPKNIVDYRGSMINLENTPLQKEDLYSLAKNVRDIHSIAFEWDASATVPDQQIEQIVDQIIKQQYNISTPRLVITTISRIVEMVQKGEKYQISSEIQKSNDICGQTIEEKVNEKSKYEKWNPTSRFLNVKKLCYTICNITNHNVIYFTIISTMTLDELVLLLNLKILKKASVPLQKCSAGSVIP